MKPKNIKNIVIGTMASTFFCGGALHAAPPGSNGVAEAAKRGDWAMVLTLLKKPSDVNAPLSDGTTALHWAVYHENLPLVEKLLKAGADPNAKVRVDGTPPLFLAATQGNAAITKVLLHAGANAKAVSANGTTALMLAAASGSKETVDALLQAKADPNARESVYGQTPLMFAAAKNRAKVIRVLINRGADPNATSTVKLLSSARVDDDGNPLPARGFGRNVNGANAESGGQAGPGQEQAGPGQGRRRRAAAGPAAAPSAADPATTPDAAASAAFAPPPQRTFGGNTALTLAAREGHLPAVQALLEMGADINAANAGDKSTPLLTAICNGHFDVAHFLLNKGADPNRASVDGLTPLYATIDTQWAPVGWAPNPLTDQEETNYLVLMKAMIDKKADVNARLVRKLWFRPTHHNELWIGTAGSTAFWRAAQATDLAAMKLLIAHGADAKITTDDGDNALMVASGLGWNGNFSVQAHDSALATVRYCLALGLDPLPADTSGYTALAGAAYRGDNALVELLIIRGAKVDVRTKRGWSVTDMANGPSLRSSVPVKHPQTIALLRKLGAPKLTPTDNEEILGVARPRPVAATTTPTTGGNTENTAQPAVPEATPNETKP